MRDSDKRSSLRSALSASLFCALIIIGSYIRIPFIPPFTLQLLFVNTAALTLGKKWGSISVILYVLCGLAGLPVFSSGGGAASVFSLSFGFVLGFIPGAFFAGMISEGTTDTKMLALASFVDLACVYTCGSAYFIFLKSAYFAEDASVAYALSACVLPFVIPDIFKIAASIILAKKLKRT